jgi:hypothetical protein
MTPPSTPQFSVQGNTKRPGLIARASKDKLQQQQGHVDPSKASPRRSSWISSLSSKLASQQQQQGATPPNALPQQHQQHQQQQQQQQQHQNQQQAPPGQSAEKPYVPQAPKSGFLSNALRRLSSSSQLGQNRAVAGVSKGGVIPRRIMNVDQTRPRCLLPELNQSKLRRVAFCVDVEIAGGPRYSDDDGGDKKALMKDKKTQQRAEGEALKHPAVAEEVKKVLEDNADSSPGSESPNGADSAQPASPTQPAEKSTTRKKEKKKRSEEERKERKEQKRKKAEENGTVPMQFTREADEDGNPLPDGADTPPRPLDRPTTDPLRIYRRCCQLRETPVLKRISEQLANSANCALGGPGVVVSLDLTGSRLQLSDVMTLSDWLAIVPVRKLILADADLTDEGIRVILAGLLAAKSINFTNRKPGTRIDSEHDRCGQVHKLDLKNNPKMSNEGWKHVSLFIYMCKSLRSLELSMNPFPESPTANERTEGGAKPAVVDVADIFSKSISERLGGGGLEELIMAECGLSQHQIRKIADAVTVSGVKRLGLAGNEISHDGLEYVVHYIRSGVCHGIDLGGNDFRGNLDILADAFHQESPLWALSLADCNLEPADLKPLFSGLLDLPDLRFLDLSHNPDLFTSQPSALGLLRKFLPMLPNLKRVHSTDNDMSPAQAIALAEILPECTQLAHLNILNNARLSALASATDEETQEEACALYASLMMAARWSQSIICIDIDVPSADSTEVVQALARQVVAYCLRNVERIYPTIETSSIASDSSSDPVGQHDVSEVEIPEVLLHLVGSAQSQDLKPDEPAPNNDYIVGGTGVVKALSYCLYGKDAEYRRGSLPVSGADTPHHRKDPPTIRAAKAKEMSKDLLESARKIRMRLQPALLKEAKGSDDMAYRRFSLLKSRDTLLTEPGRLLFLDNTLRGMIQRFEDEYPDCRLPVSEGEPELQPDVNSEASSGSHSPSLEASQAASSTATTSQEGVFRPKMHPENAFGYKISKRGSANSNNSDSEEDEGAISHPLRRSSRHASDVSLAAKALSREEGRVHRIGTKVKADLIEKGMCVESESECEVDGEHDHFAEVREKLRELEKGDPLRVPQSPI